MLEPVWFAPLMLLAVAAEAGCVETFWLMPKDAYAAMALLDAVARLQPGVLNEEGSHQLDSFNPALDGLLDSPHYTRPEVWQDHAVPTELMSGHHAHIARWRREQSLSLTAQHRPDLLAQARLLGRLSRLDEAFIQQLGHDTSAVDSSMGSEKL